MQTKGIWVTKYFLTVLIYNILIFTLVCNTSTIIGSIHVHVDCLVWLRHNGCGQTRWSIYLDDIWQLLSLLWCGRCVINVSGTSFTARLCFGFIVHTSVGLFHDVFTNNLSSHIVACDSYSMYSGYIGEKKKREKYS